MGLGGQRLGEKINRMLEEQRKVGDLRKFAASDLQRNRRADEDRLIWMLHERREISGSGEQPARSGVPMATPVFDGAKEAEIKPC